jgi:hypothetical protein
MATDMTPPTTPPVKRATRCTECNRSFGAFPAYGYEGGRYHFNCLKAVKAREA